MYEILRGFQNHSHSSATSVTGSGYYLTRCLWNGKLLCVMLTKARNSDMRRYNVTADLALHRSPRFRTRQIFMKGAGSRLKNCRENLFQSFGLHSAMTR